MIAGKFRAINWNCPRLASLSGSLSSSHLPVCYNPNPRVLKMGQEADVKNGSPEIKKPSPKIPKLQHNGVHEVSNLLVPLFKVNKLSDKAVLPSRGSPFAAGYDLFCATETKVPARGKALIPMDLSIAIPKGTYDRVDLDWRGSTQLMWVRETRVLDADHRGPVEVTLFNHSDVDFEVKEGDRIAQLIIEKIVTPDVLEVEDLDATVRGAGGFGSTGV